MSHSVTVQKIDSIKNAITAYEDIISITYSNFFTNIFKKDKVIINFSKTSLIRNNYLSIIGMAIEILKNRNIEIEIILPKQIGEFEIDMKFIEKYSKQSIKRVTEKNAKILKYTNIKLDNMDEEIDDFYKYFSDELSTRMTNLSSRLLKKITQKILELFSNVSRHSNSKLGLFCSGQFFPDRHKFYFTIVDNGVTIKRNVNKFKQKERFLNIFKPLNGKDSIEWAMKDNNSTTGEGGLGLSLLKKFIEMSDGSLEIISSNGYYSLIGNKEKYRTIREFSGTIISVCLDTNDDKYFDLKR